MRRDVEVDHHVHRWYVKTTVPDGELTEGYHGTVYVPTGNVSRHQNFSATSFEFVERS